MSFDFQLICGQIICIEGGLCICNYGFNCPEQIMDVLVPLEMGYYEQCDQESTVIPVTKVNTIQPYRAQSDYNTLQPFLEQSKEVQKVIQPRKNPEKIISPQINDFFKQTPPVKKKEPSRSPCKVKKRCASHLKNDSLAQYDPNYVGERILETKQIRIDKQEYDKVKDEDENEYKDKHKDKDKVQYEDTQNHDQQSTMTEKQQKPHKKQSTKNTERFFKNILNKLDKKMRKTRTPREIQEREKIRNLLLKSRRNVLNQQRNRIDFSSSYIIELRALVESGQIYYQVCQNINEKTYKAEIMIPNYYVLVKNIMGLGPVDKYCERHERRRKEIISNIYFDCQSLYNWK